MILIIIGAVGALVGVLSAVAIWKLMFLGLRLMLGIPHHLPVFKREARPLPYLWGCDPALPSARWDRKGIDRAIGRASMIPINDLFGEEEPDRALETGRYARTRR
jgi:hypothetical protein